MGLAEMFISHRETATVVDSPDNLVPQRLGHRFRLGVHVQLIVDALHVERNGVDASELRSNLLAERFCLRQLESRPPRLNPVMAAPLYLEHDLSRYASVTLLVELTPEVFVTTSEMV